MPLTAVIRIWHTTHAQPRMFTKKNQSRRGTFRLHGRQQFVMPFIHRHDEVVFMEVVVAEQRKSGVSLLFYKEHNLEERIIKEQFTY